MVFKLRLMLLAFVVAIAALAGVQVREDAPWLSLSKSALADDDDDDGDDDGGDDNGGDDDDDDDDDDSGGGSGGGGAGLSRDNDDSDRPIGPVTQVSGEDDDRVPDEILTVNASSVGLERLTELGFTIRDQVTLGTVGVSVTRLGVPSGLNAGRALSLARQVSGTGDALPNTLYTITQSNPPSSACTNGGCYYPIDLGLEGTASSCGSGLVIGIADTAVDRSHPALRSRNVYAQSFRNTGFPSPERHGTAVASLLVGSPSSGFPGVVPGATLLAADVFHLDSDGRTRATVADLAAGIDWLAANGASVVNVSLAGRSNDLLATTMEGLADRGIVFVAAAGNNGPSAPPAYPAAYPAALSITAVDVELRPYALANRGEYITFAAPGVSIWTAAAGGDGDYYTGTSFAAALASGRVAHALATQGLAGQIELVQTLRGQTMDLGAAGRDPVFGWGLLPNGSPCG